MKQYQVILEVTILLALTIIGQSAHGTENFVKYDRYMSFINKLSQINPYGLNLSMQVDFPKRIQTTGQAIEFILAQTGNHLLKETQVERSVREMYHQQLPNYQRSLGPTTLKNALLALSGDAYQIVVNPVHRLVTYKVRGNYKKIYGR